MDCKLLLLRLPPVPHRRLPRVPGPSSPKRFPHLPPFLVGKTGRKTGHKSGYKSETELVSKPFCLFYFALRCDGRGSVVSLHHSALCDSLFDGKTYLKIAFSKTQDLSLFDG